MIGIICGHSSYTSSKRSYIVLSYNVFSITRPYNSVTFNLLFAIRVCIAVAPQTKIILGFTILISANKNFLQLTGASVGNFWPFFLGTAHLTAVV